MSGSKTKALKAAIPHTLPVMAGYMFMGMAFGMLLKSKGYSVLWAFLMSVTIYAGAMQFVAVQILTSPFSLLTAGFMTLMVNARHLFYGLSVLDLFKSFGKKKGYMIFALTDETFSLFCAAKPPTDVNPSWFYFFIALLNQSYWVLGSVLGGLIGAFIPFELTGIDFVMTALFIVIFIEQWFKDQRHFSALIGVGAAYGALMIFGADGFVIPAMLIILVVLLIIKKPMEAGGRV